KSKKIAKNLGLKEPAHLAKICVDCHGHWIPAERRGERFKFEEGITCESCHGPAEKWITPHVNPVSDPAAHHKANIDNGLYDTADATSRARLCLSCHFGNKDKLVTHRIMGAGHPRMSFELDTFTEIAPKHFSVDKDYAERKTVWDGVKTWAVGQALAVSETMDILADDKRGRDGIFPELVLFDCHACHHAMSDGRWKPKSAFGPSISPGLVRLNDANMMMLKVLASSIDAPLGERVREQVQKLHRAAAGDGDLKGEAAALKKLAAETVPVIARSEFNAARVRKVLSLLIDDGLAGHYSDYAAAEQATLALQSVGSFLARQGGLPGAPRFNATLKKLHEVLKNDEKYQPQQFVAQLQALRAQVQ
ncbi:MAG TPA: multiheme c-type cytochrome, partial [Usitatibacteraceae bacterium]|nr:multiheme c-type cytochrome [Usitatibacteraceae bacterium]